MGIEKEQDDLILGKAFSGMKNVSAEDAFKKTLRGRVLAEARRVDAGGRRRLGSPRRWMVAAACAAGVLIAATAIWHFTAGVPKAAALNEVFQRLGGVRSVTYRITWYTDGQVQNEATHYMQRPHLLRTEMADGDVFVHDYSVGVMVSWSAKTRHASLSKLSCVGSVDVMTDLKNTVGSSGQLVRRERVRGEDCLVYRVGGKGQSTVVWVDAHTLLPARIEQSTPNAAHKNVAVLDQFRLDEPVDPSMFSQTLLQGYTLLDDAKPTELRLEDPLRLVAHHNGGVLAGI